MWEVDIRESENLLKFLFSDSLLSFAFLFCAKCEMGSKRITVSHGFGRSIVGV